ncbi:11288_t:CDS:2 [Funneliformis geosporum]|uniref:8350_t:CDS:1 n=1 Tax=Funneliformis geosporum TaxID=1117311 RepID=A0A9W4WKT4_9GLOM|nr:11288_t:CDS:2 [Funneliformis geosporum]CAI2169443.1 8350_t:CDS:2 [Funneliformis geosporum]
MDLVPEAKEEANINSEQDSKNWSKWNKKCALAIISLIGMLGPLGASAFFPAILQVKEDLKTTHTLVNTSVAIYNYMRGFAPLFWASYSDIRGTRRNVYLLSMMIVAVSSLVTGFSSSIYWLMFFRLFQSFGISSVHCLAAGVLSDIYIPTERGRAIGTFNFIFFSGAFFGPPLGGFLTQYISWRAFFWFVAIYSFVMFLLVFFFLPETYNPRLENKKDKKSFVNPFSPILLLRYPNITFVVLYWIWIVAIHYVVNILIPKKFNQVYGLNAADIGLLYLSPGLGMSIGSYFGGKISDFQLSRNIESYGGVFYPELRLNAAWFGAALTPFAYLLFGWSLERALDIAYPIASAGIGTFVSQIAVNSLETYLIDSLPDASASVIALQNIIRSIVSSTMVILAAPLDDSIGIGWTMTLMIGINLLTFVGLIAVYFWGRKWRESTVSSIPRRKSVSIIGDIDEEIVMEGL